MLYVQPKLSLWWLHLSKQKSKWPFKSVCYLVFCVLGPDLKKKEKAHITSKLTGSEILLDSTHQYPYPKSVVPGSCAESRPVG